MTGNRVIVRTLNLDCEFKKIEGQLNEIADDFLK